MTKELYNILWDYDLKKSKIKEIEIEIDELETRLMPSGIRYDKDKIQSSPSDAMSEILSKVADLKTKRDQLIVEGNYSLERLIKFINQLDDPTERLMAKYHYVNGISWSKITAMMNYASESTIYYHRRNLIRELEKLVVFSSMVR